MLTDKATIQQVLGCLIKHPQFLSEIDKYSLDLTDFSNRFERYIFHAIQGLYQNGATTITTVDIDNFLATNDSAHKYFEQQNGLEYIEDILEFSNVENFDYYYNKLKKINLLRALKKQGMDISEFYIEDLTNPKAAEVNQTFEQLELIDIINQVKRKVLALEQSYIKKGNVESWSVANEIDNIISHIGDTQNIGLSVNGEIFTQIINGAELGALTIRSLASGVGKTRLAVADACRLAYPFYFDTTTMKWVQNGGHHQNVLFIMTEQTPEQILRMILAYLTGIEESKFRYGALTEEENKRINKAKQLILAYRDNLQLMRIPDPTIEQVRLMVREKVITSNIKYVFMDYVFISPGILNEFRGHNIRNDEALLLMTTALKDLAIELNISVFTSTQVNARIDENKEIRNEATLAGGRSTINKADNGIIGARPTKEELDLLKQVNMTCNIEPNLVFDVFKVRSGRWTQVRIWSYWNPGTLRLKDLFLTDSRLQVIDDFFNEHPNVTWELDLDQIELLKQLND